MAIKTTTNIDIDFYDKKYILINAKQLDRGSRFLAVTCYNHGKLISLDDRDHAAYIRYRKPDEYGIFNFCTIEGGKIIVEITEQMLVVEGMCVADLVVVGRDQAKVDDTGAIVNLDEATVLSTMPIYFDVTETAVNNSEIESSYEYSAFNQDLANYWKRFEDAIKATKSSEKAAATSETNALNSANKAQSYAVGGTDTRENEDVDNAEYYSQMSKSYAMGNTGIVARDGENTDNAEYYSRLAKSYTMGDFDGSTGTRNDEGTENAKVYMETAEEYMKTTDGYMKTTEGYMGTTESYMNTSDEYKNASNSYMKTTEGYMTTTNGYMNTTKSYMESTDSYMDKAKASEEAAKVSETNAFNSADKAQSYAVGGTGTRDGEDTNNALYYYNLTKDIVVGLDTGFIPMGTISFSELGMVEKATGYIYNIRDDFVTDESFAEGSGRAYTAGVNVYCRSDGLWDAFGGTTSPTATLSEVKDYLGI